LKINPKFYHIALILFCAAIFILSSIPGEEFPKVDFEFSDKIVHFLIYGVLFILFFYSLKNQSKSIKLQKSALEFALLFTVVYGGTDEIHQYFVPMRSCELSDWIADILGALMVYYMFKFYLKTKIKNAALVLLIPCLLPGCTGTGGFEKEKVSVTSAEAWLDLMPGVGDADDPLGFLITVKVEPAATTDRFEIRDLTIFLNNDTVSGKRFQTEVLPASGDSALINVSQLNQEPYLDYNNDQPLEALFEFSLYKNSKPLKTLRTSKLTIKKVY